MNLCEEMREAVRLNDLNYARRCLNDIGLDGKSIPLVWSGKKRDVLVAGFNAMAVFSRRNDDWKDMHELLIVRGGDKVDFFEFAKLYLWERVKMPGVDFKSIDLDEIRRLHFVRDYSQYALPKDMSPYDVSIEVYDGILYYVRTRGGVSCRSWRERMVEVIWNVFRYSLIPIEKLYRILAESTKRSIGPATLNALGEFIDDFNEQLSK